MDDLLGHGLESTYLCAMYYIFTDYDVENAYLDEKEEALLALKLLAEFTG